jgi:hypothetical protein
MLLAMTPEEWTAVDKSKYVDCAVFKVSPEYLELMELLDARFSEVRKTITTNPQKKFWELGGILPIYNEKKKNDGLTPMLLNLPLVHFIKEVNIEDTITTMFYDGLTAEKLMKRWNEQYYKHKFELTRGAYDGKLIIINKRNRADSWATLLWPMIFSSIIVLVTKEGLVQYKLPAQSRLMNGVHKFLSEEPTYNLRAYNTATSEFTTLPVAACDPAIKDVDDLLPTSVSIFNRNLAPNHRKWINIWSPSTSPSPIETWTFNASGQPLDKLNSTITLGAIIYSLIDKDTFNKTMETNMVPDSVIANMWPHSELSLRPSLMAYAALSPNRANMVDRFLETINIPTSSFMWAAELEVIFGYLEDPDDLILDTININLDSLNTSWYSQVHKELVTSFGISEHKYAPWMPPHLTITSPYSDGDFGPTVILHDALLAVKTNILAWILYQIIAVAFKKYPTNISQLNAFMSLNFGIGRSDKSDDEDKFLLKPWYCNMELKNHYEITKKHVGIPESVWTEYDIKKKPF